MAKFEVVPDLEEPVVQPQEHPAALSMVMLALKSLSQRALVAIDNLFMLLTVGSVFWLAMSIPHPDTFQLVEIGMYAAFVLAANWIVRRR
jgi:hypothetical protein